MVHEKKVLKTQNPSFTLSLFCLFEWELALHLNKIKTPSPKHTLCPDRLKLNPRISRKKILVYLFIVSSLFFNYLPCKRKLALLFNKLESPSPKHTKTCSIRLKLAAWFFKFLKNQTLLLTLSNYVPFEELNPYLNKFTNPSPKHLVPRLIEIGPVVLEKMILKH